jgi:hypothetical protein
MIHLQWETTASPERDAASPAGDAVSPEGDLLASPNFGICDTTRPPEKTYRYRTTAAMVILKNDRYRVATAMEIYALNQKSHRTSLKHVFFDQLRLGHTSRLSIVIRLKFSKNCRSPIKASGLAFLFLSKRTVLDVLCMLFKVVAV